MSGFLIDDITLGASCGISFAIVLVSSYLDIPLSIAQGHVCIYRDIHDYCKRNFPVSKPVYLK